MRQRRKGGGKKEAREGRGEEGRGRKEPLGSAGVGDVAGVILSVRKGKMV